MLIAIAIIGTYTFVVLDSDFKPDNSVIDNHVTTISNSSASEANTKNWHKIDSFNGVGDYSITLNSGGNPIKIVSSAMPIKNYADNFMYTGIIQSGYIVGSSQLSWNEKSAVATKLDTIEFRGSGTYYIYTSAYELLLNLEIYDIINVTLGIDIDGR